MSKMTVAEAADYYKVSKEAIHNRVRRGTLDCVVEHGTKYIVAGDAKSTPQQNSGGNDKYYSYIEQENSVLKAKIAELEGETRSLREQREQMLIAEKEKIEQIYKERDTQLKNVLQVVASKFLALHNMDAVIDEAVASKEEAPDDDVIDVLNEDDDLVSLKQFLKLKMYSKKKREKIAARFEEQAEGDTRILLKDGKYYLKPNHFDYSDLIR
ncbi:DNA-binding protein [bacterium]|jgi:valyl-tRNA synthetase|nr:DNA-binding protein [bacterium]